MIKQQRGVGMMEVLVALFILAIGVLGFSVLQLRALQATAEATDRTMAMTLARDLTDRMRVNRLALGDYTTAINTTSDATVSNCVGAAITYAPNCDAKVMAVYDASQIKRKAAELGQSVVMKRCDGSARTCVYVAWGMTEIDADDVSQCMEDGVYKPDAQCLVMEAF